MTNKEQFLKVFEENYKSLKWERKDQDLTTSLFNFKIVFNSGRDGLCLQALRKSNSLGYSFDVKDFPQIKKLKNELWDLISQSQEDLYWQNVLENLYKVLQ